MQPTTDTAIGGSLPSARRFGCRQFSNTSLGLGRAPARERLASSHPRANMVMWDAASPRPPPTSAARVVPLRKARLSVRRLSTRPDQ